MWMWLLVIADINIKMNENLAEVYSSVIVISSAHFEIQKAWKIHKQVGAEFVRGRDVPDSLVLTLCCNG